MTEFLKILGLTVLGVIAFFMIAFFGIWMLLWIWPIIVIALSITIIIYLIELIRISKPKKTKRSEK